MSVINYTSRDRYLLARLMRAEAVGEGELGMLMVGNVCVNRVLADCLVFKNIRTIEQMVYQNPGGFAGTKSPLFVSAPTSSERALADRVLKGEYYHPATNGIIVLVINSIDNRTHCITLTIEVCRYLLVARQKQFILFVIKKKNLFFP